MAKPKNESPQIQTFETSLLVKVEVSREEKDAAATKLANATELHNSLISDRKASTSDYTERISYQRGIMSSEAKTVKHGLREEETPVRMEFDRALNQVRYFRLDPDELLNGEDWRPITDRERSLADAMRQENIPGTDGEGESTEEAVGGLERDEE